MPFQDPFLSSQYHRPHHRYLPLNQDDEQVTVAGRCDEREVASVIRSNSTNGSGGGHNDILSDPSSTSNAKKVRTSSFRPPRNQSERKQQLVRLSSSNTQQAISDVASLPAENIKRLDTCSARQQVIPLPKTLTRVNPSSLVESPPERPAPESDLSTGPLHIPPLLGWSAHQPPLMQKDNKDMSYPNPGCGQRSDAMAGTKEEPEDMDLDGTPSPVRGGVRPALKTSSAIDETVDTTERSYRVTSISHDYMDGNSAGQPQQREDTEDGEPGMGCIPALPIHALTCDDEAEEEVLISDDEEGDRLMVDGPSEFVSLETITTMEETVSAERVAAETNLPLVPPPQDRGLVRAPAIPEPPARLPHPGPRDTYTPPVLPASSDSSSTSSPPRPFLPTQPTGSMFERRILPPPRAPQQAPPFGRRATIGSDVFSSRLSSFPTVGQDIVSGSQRSDRFARGYDIPPLTPGILGRSIDSADRPRPTSSPGPGTRPALGTPHRRRGSSYVPGLSSSNPARTYTPPQDISRLRAAASMSFSILADTNTLSEHRRRPSTEHRLHAFSPYPAPGSRGTTSSRQTITPSSELDDPLQAGSGAGPSVTRPSVLERRLAEEMTEVDQVGRRSSVTGKSVKSTRMGMACIICRKRKIKCSGDQPCEECARHDRVCQYKAIPVQESIAERERRNRRTRGSSEREF